VVAGVAGMLGWSFFPWQHQAADVAMEYFPGAGGAYCYRTVGIDVARQNGKTTLVLSRIATQLIVPRSTVAYTAQDRVLAVLKWGEHVERLMDTPFKDRVAFVRRVNHGEMLVMHNGSRYLPVTPSKRKAARSLTIDLAVIDEAHAHQSMDIVSAIQPTMAARASAQLWLLSNAGDFDSGLWNHYTDLGRLEVNNPASSMCWVEYSADEDADVLDHEAWRAANPSLGLPNGVVLEALADAALTMDPDIFRREHLNVKMSPTASTGIDGATWAACRDDDTTIGDRVALGLAYTSERDRGALVAAGLAGERTPIEVVAATSDLEVLVQRTIDNAQAFHAVVVIDRGNPAASTIPRLEQARVKVRMIPVTELAAACGDLYDAAKTARLSHQGDYRLTDAVASASKRKLGERWVWRPRGGADITPLQAATMARWGVVTDPPRRSAYDDEHDLTVV
jgi:phage terminase large subunit-like protein